MTEVTTEQLATILLDNDNDLYSALRDLQEGTPGQFTVSDLKAYAATLVP